MIKKIWLKKELEVLETRNWYEKVPLLDVIYVVPSRKKHNSGYKLLNVYGIAYNDDGTQIIYAKCISSCSDVLNVSINHDVVIMPRFSSLFSVDSLECGVVRYFLNYKDLSFKVGQALSSLDIEIVKNKRD